MERAAAKLQLRPSRKWQEAFSGLEGNLETDATGKSGPILLLQPCHLPLLPPLTVPSKQQVAKQSMFESL